jgi:excisionase family DNA binding protein
VPAFADYLGVRPQTIRKWIDCGLLPAYQFPLKPGGELRIRKTDAVLFIEQSRIKPVPRSTDPSDERQEGCWHESLGAEAA